QIGALAYSPDGRLLASGAADDHDRVWDCQTGEERLDLKHRSWIQSVRFAPDGRVLATVGGRIIYLWDPATGETRGELRGHREKVRCLAFSPDGRTLASAAEDRVVRLWDVADLRQRQAFKWQVGEVHAVAFAPDGMTMAAGGDADIVVWDVD